MEEEQIIYLGIDDSGQLNEKEKFFAYGVIAIFGRDNLNKFIINYESIKSNIFLNPDYENVKELKGYTLELKDKLRLLKLIHTEYNAGLYVCNDEILKKEILINNLAQGRYKDFALKLLIKDIIINFINAGQINPHKPLSIRIHIDEQSTKSDGLYSLKDGIYEELKVGITNFNYNFKTSPVIFNDLKVFVNYKKSHQSNLVQAADLIAHDLWRYKMFHNFKIDINHIHKFP